MKKETKKAPAIRFRGFNDDWEQRKLEDFGRATGGISIESEFNKEGKYKVISIGNYSENSTYTDQGIRCNLTEKTQNRILNKNDLTMILNDKTAVGRIIGRVLLIEQDNSYVQHFTIFTPPRKLTKLVYTRPELSPLDFLWFGP